MLQQKLINNFLIEISDAIALYGEKAQPLSLRRQEDIKKLKALLSAPRNDLSEYIVAVRTFIPQIKTGVGIFQTGRSRFKKKLLEVLNFYNDPVIVLLMRMEKEYRDKKDTFLNYLEKLSHFIDRMRSSRASKKAWDAYLKDKANKKGFFLNFKKTCFQK